MNPIVLQVARDELDRAVEWYFRRNSSAAVRFMTGVDTIFKDIATNPRSCGWVTKNYRRCPVTGFPYGIIYRPGEVSTVVSIAHTSRRFAFWRGR